MNVTPYLKKALMVWGAISLLGFAAFYLTVAFQMSTRNVGIVKDEDRDVRMVRDFFGYDSDSPVAPIYSYHPTGSWSGDYFKAFALQLDRIEESDLQQRGDVFRGDRLSPVFQEAVEFAVGFVDTDRMDWFPKKDQILSSAYFVAPVRTVLYGTMPDSAAMIIARPEDGMAFYIAAKM